MKPEKGDIPINIKISGIQLDELQKHTWLMAEAFGLDSRIARYQGVRPLKLYSWNLDCLLDVISIALDNEKEYPNKDDEGYIKLHELYVDLKQACTETYG